MLTILFYVVSGGFALLSELMPLLSNGKYSGVFHAVFSVLGWAKKEIPVPAEVQQAQASTPAPAAPKA